MAYGKSTYSKAQARCKEAYLSEKLTRAALPKLKTHPLSRQLNSRNIHHDISYLYPHMGPSGDGGRRR